MGMFLGCSAVTSVLTAFVIWKGRDYQARSNDQAVISRYFKPISTSYQAAAVVPSQGVLPLMPSTNRQTLEPLSLPYSKLLVPSEAQKKHHFKVQSTQLQTPSPLLLMRLPPAPVPIYATQPVLMCVQPPAPYQVPFPAPALPSPTPQAPAQQTF